MFHGYGKKGGYVLWFWIARGICSMVKNRKEVYVPWLRNRNEDMFYGEE